MQFLKDNSMHKMEILLIATSFAFFCGCTTLKAKNYSSLGSYYSSENDFNKAIEYLNKALELDPENTGYVAMLGWAYFKHGNYDEAISVFERLSNMDASVIDAYTGIGWSNFKKSDYDTALIYFEKAIDIDPNSSDAFAGMGWCNFKKGNSEEAERYLNIALIKGMRYKRDNPKSKTEPEAHRALGYLNFSKNDFLTALRHFKIAARFMPEWNDARLKWGDSLFSLGRYKEAAGVYRHSLKYNKSIEIYDKIGWSYFYLGDKSESNLVKVRSYDAAKDAFNKALAIDPLYANSLSGLAELDKK